MLHAVGNILYMYASRTYFTRVAFKTDERQIRKKKQKSVACIFHGVSTEEECNRAHEGKSPLQGLVAWLPKKCLL